MSNINKTSQELKKKLSFDDYAKPGKNETIGKAAIVDDKKIKATYYHTAQENQALLDVYIKRLQLGKKTDKSALIGEAIKLLYKHEMGK